VRPGIDEVLYEAQKNGHATRHDRKNFRETSGRTTMNGPLAGVRVVEAGTMITAPLAAMQLGDQGADVIKVETPGIGDVMRYLGETVGGISALWTNCNRSKRSLAINLQHPDGVEAMLSVLDTADVFIQNFRPGVVDRLGIGEEVIRKRNPKIIYVSIAGFGFTGPNANRPAYDGIIQGYSGIAGSQTDPKTGEPSLLRNLISDKITAFTASQAIAAALFRRERDARDGGPLIGQHIKIAMLDAAIAFLWPDAMMGVTFQDRDRVTPGPVLSKTYNLFKTKDGFITIAALTDAHFHGLARACGQEEWIDDPRLATLGQRAMQPELWQAPLEAWYAENSTDHVLQALIANDVACAPAVDIADVASDPQVIANGTLIEHTVGEFGRLREPVPPARFSSTPSAISCSPPSLGAHTSSILEEAGMSRERIDALRNAQVIA
jgi:crotonobetainyl-CoA:carnitine CoA-transferase CaiB-like acyl-CoA transferase